MRPHLSDHAMHPPVTLSLSYSDFLPAVTSRLGTLNVHIVSVFDLLTDLSVTTVSSDIQYVSIQMGGGK